jgi:predicted O-methyltransferase YrrM
MRTAARLIRFLLTAANRYQIHSPFLFSFVCDVIKPRKPVPGELRIEAIRQECLRSREIIFKTDFGTGSGKQVPGTYAISTGRIARTSLASGREARRLYRLVRFMNAGRILEIGTSLGITTAYLGIANPLAKIITLEGCPELSQKARDHFERLGLQNIELIEGRFEDTLIRALEKLGSVDVVFIDGNHRGEALLDYFGQCLPYCNNNTVMVLDDIHASGSMQAGWDRIKQNDKVRISLDLFFSGWIMFRKESSKEHFRLRYV